MSFLAIIATAVALAASVKQVQALNKAHAQAQASSVSSAIVDIGNDKMLEKLTKAQEAMIAKFSEMYKTKQNFRPADKQGALATTAPYTSTGFIYQNAYFGDGTNADTTCSSISSVMGFPVNQCVVAGNVAMKFQLTQDSCNGGVVQYFGDKACTLMLGTSNLDPYTSICDVDYRNTDYGYPVYQSWECSSSATPVAPEGAVNLLAFQRNSCSGSVFAYLSYPVDVCLPGTDGLMVKYFCDGATPYVGAWEDPNCAGEAGASKPMESECTGDGNDDDDEYVDDITDDDDYQPPFFVPPPSASETRFPTSATRPDFAAQLFCPDVAPTLKPAFAPTTFPTAAVASTVSLTLVQKVDGIDAATFNGDALCATAFATTVASTMTGVTAANIINLSVSSASARRLTGRALYASNEAITVTYTISATTTSSADSLYYQLNSAITTGAFNTALSNYAIALGASALNGCTSSSVGYPSHSSSKKGLSGGAIAGIVIGCIAGVAILAAIIFYFINSNQRTPLAEAQPLAEMSNRA